MTKNFFEAHDNSTLYAPHFDCIPFTEITERVRVAKNNRYTGNESDKRTWSAGSIKGGKHRIKRIEDSYKRHGFIQPAALYAYSVDKTPEGKDIYEIFEGNTRLTALKKELYSIKNHEKQYLALRDLRKEINPNTNKPYTYIEAEEYVDVLNYHPGMKHTIDDIVDVEAAKGNEIALFVRHLTDTYNISTSLVCDIVAMKTGSTRMEYKEGLIKNTDISTLDTHLSEDICSFIDELNHDYPELKIKTKGHIVALTNLYVVFKFFNRSEEFKLLINDMFKKATKNFIENFTKTADKTNLSRHFILNFMFFDYSPKSTFLKDVFNRMHSINNELDSEINRIATTNNTKKMAFNFKEFKNIPTC